MILDMARSGGGDRLAARPWRPRPGSIDASHSCFLPSRQDVAVDRQATKRDAGRGEDGIAQRGRSRLRARLADAAGRLAAPDDMHFDVRHLVDAQQAIVVEVGLLDAAVLDVISP